MGSNDVHIDRRHLSENKVTIRDVALRAGVSIATVSRVMTNSPGVGESTRARVLDVIHELNYYPDIKGRMLASNSTRNIGLVIPHTSHFIMKDPFFAEVLRGVQDAINARGYRMVLATASAEIEEDLEYIKMARDGSVDGIIVLCNKVNDIYLPELKAMNFPFVSIGRAFGPIDIAFVDIDNIQSSYNAVKYLIDMGHRRIAHIAGILETTAGIERLEGYKRALVDNGLPYDESYVVEGKFTQESGYLAASRLLENPKKLPTAIFAYNDSMAIGAMRAIREKGMAIPDDISIVGFNDDPEVSYSEPPLTTVCQPIYRLGKLATEMLIEIIERDGPKQRQVILPTEIVERSSVRRLGGGEG